MPDDHAIDDCSPDQARRQFYGRRQGHKLRKSRKALIDRWLEDLAVLGSDWDGSRRDPETLSSCVIPLRDSIINGTDEAGFVQVLRSHSKPPRLEPAHGRHHEKKRMDAEGGVILYGRPNGKDKKISVLTKRMRTMRLTEEELQKRLRRDGPAPAHR